jgi:multicomponent Na+:H+ antiporter subunit D
MISPIPPAFVFIIGALVISFLRGNLRRGVMLLLPVLAFIDLLQLPAGDSWVVSFLGQELVLSRIDRLSLIFGYIFILIGLITTIYALHVEDTLQNMAGLLYTGSALGVVFAGDLFTFFIFWELLTVFCVQLIWGRCTKKALGAGFRYLLFHVVGGLILLAGIVLRVHHTGSLDFSLIGLDGGPGSMLIFLGLGINCAWPFLHTWLSDAYPEATITGTIFLSAFTTKAAVYALARSFPGAEPLIWLGALMAGFPIFFAVIENDLRRVLAYSLINQVGFMVCGIGIGTQLAINGAVAHAFNDILFKGLLFMTMGAVMYRTGKINATDLGGLYRTMPLTCIFCIVGAASISAFPLFSGFVSKSMVMDAAGSEHLRLIWFILLFASAGVFHHAGIKIPYFAFFSHDSGLRPKEAPLHMLIAMGMAAFLCIFIGSFPQLLYSLLPYQPVGYEPYNFPHVLAQTQILFFSALAFALLLLSGIYPAEIRCINLDADWFYRKGGRLFYRLVDVCFNTLNRVCDQWLAKGLTGGINRFCRHAPARVSAWFLLPLYRLVAPGGADNPRRFGKSIQEAFENGVIPIGLSAAVSGLFLVLLFYLN